MKSILLFVFSLIISSAGLAQKSNPDELQITQTIDNWHLAAANADFNTYFGLMTNDAVFIGTDATENWQKDEFKTFAKPYFDRGKAWSFSAIERNVYLSSSKDIAWFDELLDTQMKICRGSGVLKKVEGEWKIAHYVLSIAIPNDNVSKVVEDKMEFDTNLIKKLKERE